MKKSGETLYLPDLSADVRSDPEGKVIRKQTLRSLLLSCQKKDGCAWPRPSLIWHDTDFSRILPTRALPLSRGLVNGMWLMSQRLKASLKNVSAIAKSLHVKWTVIGCYGNI